MTEHIDHGSLIDHAQGVLVGLEKLRAEQHLSECERCTLALHHLGIPPRPTSPPQANKAIWFFLGAIVVIILFVIFAAFRGTRYSRAEPTPYRLILDRPDFRRL